MTKYYIIIYTIIYFIVVENTEIGTCQSDLEYNYPALQASVAGKKGDSGCTYCR